MRVIRRHLFVWVLLVAGPAMADELREPPTGIDLTYRAYVAGFGFAAIEAGLRQEGEEFRMTAHLAVEGLLAELLPWSTTLRSWGQFDDGNPAGLRVARLRAENSWRGRRRHVQAAYHAGEAVIENAQPPPYDGARRVEIELTKDTVDPLGAALALGRSLARGQTCRGRMAVFDGRRRYDLLLEHGGQQRLGPDKRSRFTGEATLCRFRIDRLAGFRPNRRPWVDPDKPTRVWFARAVLDALPIPVRIEAPTPLGKVTIYLVEAVRRPSASTARASKPR